MINWELLYNKLLETKSAETGEKHHIVPKHDGGKDEDGIVILERKHHILAHYIRFRWKGQIYDKKAATLMSGTDKYYWEGLFGSDSNRARKILQIEYKTGKVVNSFYGTREANRETKISYSKIAEVCNGNRETAGGYKWMYADQMYSYILENKTVFQKNKITKELVNIFSSGNEAGDKTGVDKGDIWRVINGKQNTAGGFIWEEKKVLEKVTVKI
jgi:hypothetical protein